MTRAAAMVRRLSHRYGRTVALDYVTLEIPARCMVGLIGPDGVGKSTLLALISGVRRIQEGEVFALDGDMRDREHRRLSLPRIAYMPQGLGRNLYPTLTVFENLDFFGRLFDQPKSEREWRIKDLLASTGLDPFPDRPAGKLSGGMKQKLSLCCSLIHSRPLDPRPTDHRGRPAVSPAIMGADRPDSRAAIGHECRGCHRLYGRGGAVRLARRNGC